MKRTEYHLWQYPDPRTGRPIVTRHLMTEERARITMPEAVKVPGSLEVRMLPETPEEMRRNSTGHVQRGPGPDVAQWVSLIHAPKK
jgi:hypothetical protein